MSDYSKNYIIIITELKLKGTVVDVRSTDEFKIDHFPGAVNIPLEMVNNHIADFKVMEKTLMAYCRSGNRSRMATPILKSAGIQEVINAGSLDDIL